MMCCLLLFTRRRRLKITRRIKRDKKNLLLRSNGVLKVLEINTMVGLIRKPVIDTDNLVRKLNSPELRKTGP